MKDTTKTKLLRRSALVVALLGLIAGTASAQTYDLVADVYDWNGVPMWGFALDTGQACGAGGAWNLGPMLEVDAATTTGLVINLRNCLPDPVSIVIPGQALPAGSAPTFVTDGAGRQRAASFTSEAAASGGTVSYTWPAPKAGTYLYHSGSDLGKQVHMGLYGALIVDYNAGTGEAYPGITYDVDAVLVASEIDPALHLAVDTTSTPLDYRPRYFLVNGVADGMSSLVGPDINETVLLRLINAGSFNYVPNLLGEDLEWVAEDGNPYPYPRMSYGALLAAGKTLDAVWTPVTPGPHKLYDRRLHMSTDGEPGGGLVATIQVGAVTLPTAVAAATPANPVPVYAGPAVFTTVQLDGSDSTGNPPNPNAITYSWTIVSQPACNGAVLSDATAEQPTFDVCGPGTYVVSLEVTDANPAGTSPPDVVVINTNLPPIAVAAGPAEVNVGSPVQLNGGGSTDPDGDAITYSWALTDVPVGSLAALSDPTAANPTFTPDAVGDYTAELIVSDFELDSAPDSVVVTAAVGVNGPPTANPDYTQALWCKNNEWPACPAESTVVIDVLGNDEDLDGIAGIDPATVSIVTSPTQGGTIVTINGTTGAITYKVPRGWRGTDYFSYMVCDTMGACSDPAAVLVNVVNNLN